MVCMNNIIIAPKSLDAHQVFEIENEFYRAKDPKDIGWQRIVKYDMGSHREAWDPYPIPELFVRRILGEGLVEVEDDRCMNSHYSKDGRTMAIRRGIGGQMEIWVKDVMLDRKIDMVDCLLLYGGGYNPVAIVKGERVIKSDVILLHSNDKCFPLFSLYRSIYPKGHLDIYIPKTKCVEIAQCEATSLSVIGGHSIVGYENYGDGGYEEVTRYFINNYLLDEYRKDHYVGCHSCQRFVPKDDVVESNSFDPILRCPDCIAELTYKGEIRASSDIGDFFEALDGIERKLVHANKTIKSIQYTVEPWGDVLVGIDMTTSFRGTWIHGKYHKSIYASRDSAHVEVPILVKNSEPVVPINFDRIDKINVRVSSVGEPRGGYILVFVKRKTTIALLFIEEDDGTHFWGRISTEDLEKVISASMSDGKPHITAHIMFSTVFNSPSMIRCPVSIQAEVKGHEHEFNAIKQEYAKKLLQGKK